MPGRRGFPFRKPGTTFCATTDSSSFELTSSPWAASARRDPLVFPCRPDAGKGKTPCVSGNALLPPEKGRRTRGSGDPAREARSLSRGPGGLVSGRSGFPAYEPPFPTGIEAPFARGRSGSGACRLRGGEAQKEGLANLFGKGDNTRRSSTELGENDEIARLHDRRDADGNGGGVPVREGGAPGEARLEAARRGPVGALDGEGDGEVPRLGDGSRRREADGLLRGGPCGERGGDGGLDDAGRLRAGVPGEARPAFRDAEGGFRTRASRRRWSFRSVPAGA